MRSQLGASGCWFPCTGVRRGRSPRALGAGVGPAWRSSCMRTLPAASIWGLGLEHRAGRGPQPLPVGSAPTEAASTGATLPSLLFGLSLVAAAAAAGGRTLASEPLPLPAAGARPRTRMLLPCARGALLGGRVGARAVGVPADPGDTCPPLPSESRLAVHCPPPDPEPSRSAISALRGVRGRLCQVTQSGQWPWPGSTWQQWWAPC